FFCQAEDGIRDDLVTGVQTCALPIWPILGEPLHDLGGGHEGVVGLERPRAVAGRAVDDQAAPVTALLADRYFQRVAGLGWDRHADRKSVVEGKSVDLGA